MLLLLRLNPAALDMLPSAVWQEWAPIIVDWPVTANGAPPQTRNSCSDTPSREQLRTALLTVIDHLIRTGKAGAGVRGAALPLLLLFAICGLPGDHVLSSGPVTEKFIRALAGSLVIVAAVPPTTALATVAVGGRVNSCR